MNHNTIRGAVRRFSLLLFVLYCDGVGSIILHCRNIFLNCRCCCRGGAGTTRLLLSLDVSVIFVVVADVIVLLLCLFSVGIDTGLLFAYFMVVVVVVGHHHDAAISLSVSIPVSLFDAASSLLEPAHRSRFNTNSFGTGR